MRDFGDIKKGDLGGWIEKENNLSQNDNSWIYGSAVISGSAMISGSARIKTSPINIIGLIYNITAYNDYIQIGCYLHTIKEWEKIFKEGLYRDEVKSDKEYNQYKSVVKFIKNLKK